MEDGTFSQDLRKIELNRISVIERLQTLMSKVCMKQLRNLSQDITNMSIVHTVALNQLELGGAQLKAVTLELLTELHQVRSVVVEVEKIIYNFSVPASMLAATSSIFGVWRPSYW